MSTYHKITKHPITGKFSKAIWHDDYFGKHHYGVEFKGDTTVYPAEDYEWEFQEEKPNPKNDE